MKSTKIMLVAALAAGALLVGNSSLRAQDATNTPPAADHGPGMKARSNVVNQLNLSADQKAKFQEIEKSAMDKRKALRDDKDLTKEDRKAKMKTIQDDTNAQLKTLLTADQYTKWQQLTKKAHRN